MRGLTYIISAILLLTSCKSAKNATDGSAVNGVSARKIAKQHAAGNFNKQTVDAKLKVKYANTKENLNFSVRLKIKKDEVIWLKGSKIITVFKAKITPTTVSFYSPYKKNYFEKDFSVIQKILGADITFNQLQNLLVGQAVLDLKSTKQTVEIDNNAYKLSPKKQPDLYDFFFWINQEHFKLNQQSLVNKVKPQRLDIAYPKYLKKDNTVFPENINILAKQNNKTTSIGLTVRSVVFNTEINTTFAIPSGYKELKL